MEVPSSCESWQGQYFLDDRQEVVKVMRNPAGCTASASSFWARSSSSSNLLALLISASSRSLAAVVRPCARGNAQYKFVTRLAKSFWLRLKRTLNKNPVGDVQCVA